MAFGTKPPWEQRLRKNSGAMTTPCMSSQHACETKVPASHVSKIEALPTNARPFLHGGWEWEQNGVVLEGSSRVGRN
eukprot:4300466-Amphidinium_carterae.1